MRDLIQELKRRNVFRVGMAYVVVAWLLAQAAELAFGSFEAPAWVMKVLLFVLVLGFPLALFFAWAFELTPEGIRLENKDERGDSIAPRTGQKLDRLIIVLLSLAVVYFVVDKGFLQKTTETTASPGVEQTTATVPSGAAQNESTATDTTRDKRSIAVLPFLNMSSDKDNEYFADGISEEILNVLARVPQLKVAARTSSFRYKGENIDIAEIAKALRVDHVLEGSVRRQGDKVRVTAQLIQAPGGYHLWSETYDRTLDDIFQIQDEMAGAIAETLQVKLGLIEPGKNRTGTDNLLAYEYYLRGVHFWSLRVFDDLLLAIDYFKRAIDADPNFAKAYAGLAMTYSVIEGYGDFAGPAYELAEASARRALDLDPDSAEAMAALGNTFYKTGRLPESESFLKEAVAISPNFATAHQWLGNMLSQAGRRVEGLRSLDVAVDLDPEARVIGANRANHLYNMERWAKCSAQSEQVLSYAPEYYDALIFGALCNRQLGKQERFEHFMRLLGHRKGEAGVEFVERLLAALREDGDARAMAKEFAAQPLYAFQDPASPTMFKDPDAVLFIAMLGDYDAAIQKLRYLQSINFPEMRWWLVAPDLAPLRCDVRFQRLLEVEDARPFWRLDDC